jgi:integrase/recombinase XerD
MQIVCKMRPGLELVLDTRQRNKADKLFPVKLRITYLRHQKYYKTGVYLSAEDFPLVMAKKPSIKFKDTRIVLDNQKRKADRILDDLTDFSFKRFDDSFSDRVGQLKNNVYSVFDVYIKQLRSEGRIRTAISYSNAATSLRKFQNTLTFQEIDVSFLRNYQSWMISQGNGMTTVGIYIRSLRSIFNYAISQGIIDKNLEYPFGKRKYQIPAGRNIKKGLEIDDIRKIVQYEPIPNTWESKARDFWVFSYLCNGMNPKDIMLLKYQNIDGNFIRFHRAKTRNSSSSNLKTISVPLLPQSKAIIDRLGNHPRLPEKYIFPVLTPSDPPERQLQLIQQAVKQINKYMKRIGNKLGIQKEITTYTARHSYSSILKESGVSIEHISESLGHSSILVTRSYLQSFTDDSKIKNAQFLTNFSE